MALDRAASAKRSGKYFKPVLVSETAVLGVFRYPVVWKRKAAGFVLNGNLPRQFTVTSILG